MKRSIQQGFTLIELVVVITILGILSAFAVPKFLSLDKQARVAAVQAIGGSVRSASTLVHSYALLTGATAATGSITVDGTTVSLVYGYPAASSTGIQVALQDITGFTTSGAAPFLFTKTGATGTTPANCNVSYTAPAAANTAPVIVVSSTLNTDC